MSTHARQISTLGASRKRKERGGSVAFSTPITTKAEPKPSFVAQTQPAPAGNRLIAGYLAHEFLTKGTLFGRPFDPAPAEPGKIPNQTRSSVSAQPDTYKPPAPSPPRAYADVAYLLKVDGSHIPGIVNPTQLGRWLQM